MKTLSPITNTFKMALIGIVCIIFCISCGKKKKDDDSGDGSAPTALVGAEAVTGDWTGTFNTRDDAGKSTGLLDSAMVTFTADGTFALELTDNTAAKVKGFWSEFGGKSLMLSVKESTISRIQISSSIQEVSYDIRGPNLTITGSTFELKIKRKQTAPTTSGTPGSDANSFVGHWICQRAGVETNLSIGNNYGWKAIISQEGHKPANLEGSGEIDSFGVLQLKINSSSDDLSADASLSLNRNGKVGSLQANTRGSASSLGDCRKD